MKKRNLGQFHFCMSDLEGRIADKGITRTGKTLRLQASASKTGYRIQTSVLPLLPYIIRAQDLLVIRIQSGIALLDREST